MLLAVQTKLRHQELHRLEVERRQADGSQPVLAPLLAVSEAITSAVLQSTRSDGPVDNKTTSTELRDRPFFERRSNAAVLPTDRAPARNMTGPARCDEGNKADSVFPWRIKERKRQRDDSGAATSSKEPLSLEAIEYKKRCR